MQPFVLVSLLVSILMMGAFVWVERKVRCETRLLELLANVNIQVDNPIMPKSLWRAPSALAIWVAGFFVYSWWSR